MQNILFSMEVKGYIVSIVSYKIYISHTKYQIQNQNSP